MLKPTRTILALAAGSLVLGLVGAGAAAADGQPMNDTRVPAAQPAKHHEAYGQVTSHSALKVRSQPSTHSKLRGKLSPHSKFEIECKKYGESVDGNRLWYLLEEKDGRMENAKSSAKKKDDERWVSARYVKNLGPVKFCR